VFPIALADDLAYRILGIRVEDLTRKKRRRYRIGAGNGVMISDIKKNSYLAGIGARPGDVIRQIDDYSIENSEDFKKAIPSSNSAIKIRWCCYCRERIRDITSLSIYENTMNFY